MSQEQFFTQYLGNQKEQSKQIISEKSETVQETQFTQKQTTSNVLKISPKKNTLVDQNSTEKQETNLKPFGQDITGFQKMTEVSSTSIQGQGVKFGQQNFPAPFSTQQQSIFGNKESTQAPLVASNPFSNTTSPTNKSPKQVENTQLQDKQQQNLPFGQQTLFGSPSQQKSLDNPFKAPFSTSSNQNIFQSQKSPQNSQKQPSENEKGTQQAFNANFDLSLLKPDKPQEIQKETKVQNVQPKLEKPNETSQMSSLQIGSQLTQSKQIETKSISNRNQQKSEQAQQALLPQNKGTEATDKTNILHPQTQEQQNQPFQATTSPKVNKQESNLVKQENSPLLSIKTEAPASKQSLNSIESSNSNIKTEVPIQKPLQSNLTSIPPNKIQQNTNETQTQQQIFKSEKQIEQNEDLFKQNPEDLIKMSIQNQSQEPIDEQGLLNLVLKDNTSLKQIKVYFKQLQDRLKANITIKDLLSLKFNQLKDQGLTKLQALNQQNEQIQGKLQEKEVETKKLKEQNAQLNKSFEDQKQSNKNQNDEMAKKNQELDSLKRKLQEADSQQQKKSPDLQQTGIPDKNQQLSQEIATLTQTNKNQKQQLDNLGLQVKNYDQENKKLKQTTDSLQQECKKLTQQIETIKKNYELIEQNKENELQQRNEKIIQLEKRLNEIQEDKQSIIQVTEMHKNAKLKTEE